ncbi:hypothetical protein ACFQ0D_18390, partial [Micromonospora zhanjiangensis]
MSSEEHRAGESLGVRAEPTGNREFRRATVRGAALLFGTLVLATAFIAAYAGALHKPTPRDVPVGVVRDDRAARELTDTVVTRTDQITTFQYADRAAADAALTDRAVYAVLTSNPPDGTPGFTLTTASAAGPIAADLVDQVIGTAAQRAQLPLTVTDRVPVSPDDPRGLVPFYLAIGLVLGGYLGSAVLGISIGTTPATTRRAGLRVAAFAGYAALLGL